MSRTRYNDPLNSKACCLCYMRWHTRKWIYNDFECSVYTTTSYYNTLKLFYILFIRKSILYSGKLLFSYLSVWSVVVAFIEVGSQASGGDVGLVTSPLTGTPPTQCTCGRRETDARGCFFSCVVRDAGVSTCLTEHKTIDNRIGCRVESVGNTSPLWLVI